MRSDSQNGGTKGKPVGKVGTFIGMSVLALATLAVGIGLLTIRHYSLRGLEAAKTWAETPCVMEKCEYATSGSDDGPWLDIVYRYEVEGREYRGDELDLIVGRMGDDDVFEKFVHETYPPGARATCYVNPEDPSESVLDREHGADAPRRTWLLAFPFVCAGLGSTAVLAWVFISSLIKVTTEAEPEPLELITNPGPPPRHVPWGTRAVVLAGAKGTQIAWMFMVGFVFVFILLDGPACYARLFNLWPVEATTVGRITDARELDEREFSVSIFQYTIEYEVDGQNYVSDSYTRGDEYDEGDEVPITYDPSKPGEGTISGARPSNFVWWHSAMPLGVVLLLLLGMVGWYVHNIRVLRLLKHGRVAQATWREPPQSQPGPEDEQGVPSMLTGFCFEVSGRSYRARKYNPQTKFRRRGKRGADSERVELTVLYNPRKPKRNIILGGVLVEIIDGCRSTWGCLTHCAIAPAAIVVMIILLIGAEMI